MPKRGFVRIALYVLVALVLGAQLIPVARTNPPVVPERTLESSLVVAPQVKSILDRSCRDCHSNETAWPWYSYIAPLSWKVAADVHKAREIMNFSDWKDSAGTKLEKAFGLLMASCSDVTVGRMPKAEYVFMHSKAALKDHDVEQFCTWTASEGSRLLMIKRRKQN